jgi:hypothetical protein
MSNIIPPIDLSFKIKYFKSQVNFKHKIKRVLITMAVFLMKLAVNNLGVFLIKWQ